MKYLLYSLPLLLVGCASSELMPNGMYIHQFKAERPNWLGTNTTVTRAAQCPQDLSKLQDWSPEFKLAVSQCQWVQSEWHDASSQGQIGQIVGGAFQGIGIGVAGSLIGTAGSTASATATANQAVNVPRSHH